MYDLNFFPENSVEPTPPEVSPKPIPEETEEEDLCKKTGNHSGCTLGSDCKVKTMKLHIENMY